MIDLHHIADRHFVIDERLTEWAAWVRVRPQPWKTQPMFRMYRSMARQWHAPEPKREINTLQAHEIERCVSLMPEPHRAVIRWAYVFPYIHQGKIRRELGLTDDGLAKILCDGRDMVKNRLAQRIAKVE